MDPLYVEDGPTWPKAAIGVWWPTLWFIVAFALKSNQQETYASMAAAFAFGTVIGPCFWTFGNSSGVDIRRSNCFVRWYITTWENIADGWFKIAIVILISFPLSFFFHLDATFWLTIALAFYLQIVKARDAIAATRLSGVGSEAEYRTFLKNQMLIKNNVILTMIVGVVSLGLWLLAVTPLMKLFKPIHLDDYETLIAFVLGIGLHFR